MLRTKLLHPELLATLGAVGHGSQVLITDGNFPHLTAPYEGAERVYLNLMPGRLNVAEVLEAVLSAIAVERATVMDPADDKDERPAAHAEIVPLLPAGTPVDHLRRFAFYDAVKSQDLALVIATADLRPYANVLLTVGVVRP